MLRPVQDSLQTPAGATRPRLRSATRRRVMWGLALSLGGALGPMFASVMACSPSGAASGGPVAASAAPVSLPVGPPPPAGGLPMPDLPPDWEPPSAAAGDLAGLAEAIALHPRLGLAVDPTLAAGGDLNGMQISAMVGALAPNTAVHLIDPEAGVEMGAVLLEDPPLIPERLAGGRTRWQLPQTLRVDLEQLEAWAELGDPVVLLVSPVGVETATWRRMATGAVGSCEPLTERLLEGQGESLALLEPFLDHADAVLGAIYLAELAAVVPELEAALSEFEADRRRPDFGDDDEWARYQCGRRYRTYLEPFAGCLAAGQTQAPLRRQQPELAAGASDQALGLRSPCASAPRLFLSAAARIGTVEPSDYIPADCPERLGTDYVEALRAPARTAADVAADQLDPRWMILVERMATLSEVYAALESVCAPGRRRFAPADIDALRATVSELGALYQRPEVPAHDARFLANDASFRVPGLGMVRQLARYDAGTGSAARALIAGARELGGFVRERARCQARPGSAPVMTLLLNTATGKPEHLGFFYEEELWCGDLGPL